MHQTVEKWCHALLGELGIGHADEGVELSVEDGVLNDAAEGPVRDYQLVASVLGAPHEDLVLHEVASDFTATKADLDPVFLGSRGFFEGG